MWYIFFMIKEFVCELLCSFCSLTVEKNGFTSKIIHKSAIEILLTPKYDCIMTKKLITLLTVLVGIHSFSQTQRLLFGTPVEKINPTHGKIRCATTEYETYLQNEDASRNTAAFEQWIAPKVEAIKTQLLNGKSAATVVTIPVVVHVIHNGDAVGTNENISDARVLSQITVLNQDFRRMVNSNGYNTNAVGADIEVEFCMAQRKPDGTATNGIDRVNLGTASWATESSVEGTLKPNTIWDPTQYFNIWVCAFSTSTSAELYGVLGYAQFPYGSGLSGLSGVTNTATTDGVIIDYRCFGSSEIAPGSYYTDYDLGRTATHEIGHCFGLRHIWGDNSSCTVNTADSAKDYCPDTPAAANENYDCADTYDSCPAATGNDMTENYMDYTNDSCMNIFTLNQKARILAVIQNSPRRNTLPSSQACLAPLSRSEFELFDNLKIYPNPAQEYAIINISSGTDLPDAYQVFNALGQLVVEKTVHNSTDLTIPTSEWESGVYFVKIIKQNSSKTLQLLKK